jgi:hypothetical protein
MTTYVYRLLNTGEDVFGGDERMVIGAYRHLVCWYVLPGEIYRRIGKVDYISRYRRKIRNIYEYIA